MVARQLHADEWGDCVVDASLSLVRRQPKFGPAQRRRAALIAGSIAFHVAILAPLAMRWFEPPMPRLDEDPDVPIYLEIEPRPLLRGETARMPKPIAQAASTAPAMGQARSDPSALPRTQGQTEAPPSAPNPRITAGAANNPSAASAADAWQVTPETMRAAVARSLRLGAAGCRAMDGRLTQAEQQVCDERFNEAAGRAGPLGPRTLNASEARREAGFARDGARALAEYERQRRPLSGGVGIVGPGECPGSNLGAGCAGAHLDPAIRQGATSVGNPGLGSNQRAPSRPAMRPIPGQE